MRSNLQRLFIVLAAVACGSAFAQVKPSEALQYRKDAYHVLLWNWMPLANTVRGKTPYDKAAFEKYSMRVAQIAPMLLEGFPVGSGVGKTEAKPEVWTKWADFKAKMSDFERESNTLSVVAKTGDFEKIKVQFGKVGATCKACHDGYKAE
jgi:cytochrome c556